jgi:predicted amidohydrolase YtcJ
VAEVEALMGEETEVVQLRGRMVVPGFVDSHTHFIPGGFQLSSVDLRDAGSPEEFGRRIGAFAQTVEPGVWITGGDWDHEMWGGELPRREWIDASTPSHPVLVSRLDGHMALANSLALELAGVNGSTPVPPGGEMVLDPGSGDPTGVLKDEAMGLVSRAMPDPSEEELDRALDSAIEHALSLGVTQVHHMGTWADLETFRRARAEGRLRMRVYSVVPIDTWERLRDFVVENGRGDHRLWWGGLKGFVDGSLGSTTAWFYDPYSDDPSTSGLLLTDTVSLRNWILAGDEAGLHLVVHAIGDQANDWLEKRIGPARLPTTYAFRSLLDSGAPLAFGSDWTVAPLDVRLGIYAALTRRTTDDANPGGWVPEERITLEEALQAYTWGSARAGFMEDRVGRVTPGMYADLVVLSQDLFQVDPVEIPSVQVEMTLVEGEIVYRKEG